MPTKLETRLEEYRVANTVTSKGKLAAILYCSRLAKEKGLPLDAGVLVTDGKGQVLGLGKAPVQKILADHGIKRVLAAAEVGRLADAAHINPRRSRTGSLRLAAPLSRGLPPTPR